VRPPNTLSPLMLRAVGLAVVALLLVSCSETGGVERPSASSTRTPSSLPSLTASLPNPTRSPERSESEPATETAPEPGPTRSPQRGESTSPTETAPEPTRSSETAAPPPPTQPAPETTRSSQVVAAPSPTQPETEPTRTESSAPEEPTSPTETESTAAPSPTTSPSVQPTSTESNGPTWLRWLLVALVVALAVAIPLLVRASHRREWRDALASAEDEVAWFARGLIPQLRQMGSLAEVAGGWNLAEGRVAALEDKLTALEPTAPDDVARARALDLRDAVRAARGQIRALLQAGRQETRTQDLDAVAARLEQVLGAGTPLD
jgi:outer membrane biosynthesis protein TonB